MAARKHHSFLTLFLILVLCINLLQVQTVQAEGEPPTEPPAPTQVETEQPTEPPVESTPEPVIATPAPEESEPVEPESTDPSIAEILTEVPDNTAVIVLDEEGDPLPLVSQEAAEVVEEFDPMWCPAGVLPGGAGCTINFSSIGALITNMQNSTDTYDQNGIIYFVATTGNETTGASLALTTTGLGNGDFNTLNDFNLTLQGGWNGQNGASATFTGTTNFGNNVVTVGSSGSPWIGNLTLNNFTFNGVSSGNAITIYTTTGNIALNDISVNQQAGEDYTAFLNSNSGNITVDDSLFDGDAGSESLGFFANTGGSGSIAISDTTFSDARDSNNGSTHDGATLEASTVTLTNVIANNNDGNGITINNVDLVTLNNVTAINNGSEFGQPGFNGNIGSGVFVDGDQNSQLIINGGTFNDNQFYGIEVQNPNQITTTVQTGFTCTGNDSNAAGLGCSNENLVADISAPVITPTITGTAGANGWYTSNVSVSWSVTDPESGISTSTGCTASNLTAETTGVSLTCSATNTVNLTNSVTVTIKIDKTAPTASLSLLGTQGANGWYTSDVTARTTGTDSLSGVTCTADQIISSETAGMTVNGSCTNGAGLTTNASPLTLKLDKTAPVVTLTVTAGTLGSNGWYISNVTVHTNGVESISTPITCTADQFQMAETTGKTFNGSCTNAAGLTGTAASLKIKLDKTNPTILFTGRTAPNGNGWNNTNVTLNWSCSDSPSGPAAPTVTQTVTTEGVGQSATGTCTDLAGNTASDTQGGINIDKTAPSLNLPSNIAAEATSSAGATVTYTASVTDNLDPAVVLSCSPASGTTFGMGTTTVNCSSTDAAGNTATGSFQVRVGDTAGPVIDVHADVTVQATGPDGAIVNYTLPTATDAVDGPREVLCSPEPDTLFPIGDTTVNCEAWDQQENMSTSSFVVHVVDTMAPVIAFHPDITEEATSINGATVNYTTPTANDVVDGPVAVSCSPTSGAQFPLGDTTVTCTATDQHQNQGTSSFVVHVVDTTAPVIAPHGDITVEATSAAGAVVSYSAPTATDIVDGSVAVNCSPASGTQFPLGNTTVTCNAMDSHENMATPVTFTVRIQDTTAPVLNLPATITVYATGPQGVAVIYSATASDLVDGSVPVICILPSGSVFPVGTNTVNCVAKDQHGNGSQGSFIINVQDPNAPVLSLPGDIVAEATGPSGAAVTFSVSATDVVDGPVPVTCSRSSGSTFGFGSTIVTCSATDNSGHTNSAAFMVTVQDTTAPVIAPHADVDATTESNSGTNVSYTSPATSDAVDGAGVASCSPASGSLFPLGDTTVTCTATDAHGNSSSMTFVVHVERESSSPSTSSGNSSASSFLIPLTGGELIDLDCNSILWAFGIKLSFLNLCDYQTTINPVVASDLPAALPNGSSFVMGLNVDILKEGSLIDELPAGSGIQIDFPTYEQSLDQFTVLFWDDADGDGNGTWVEISEEIGLDEIAQALNASADNELYQIGTDSDDLTALFYQILTTQKTGVFVLVQK